MRVRLVEYETGLIYPCKDMRSWMKIVDMFRNYSTGYIFATSVNVVVTRDSQ